MRTRSEVEIVIDAPLIIVDGVVGDLNRKTRYVDFAGFFHKTGSNIVHDSPPVLQ